MTQQLSFSQDRGQLNAKMTHQASFRSHVGTKLMEYEMSEELAFPRIQEHTAELTGDGK